MKYAILYSSQTGNTKYLAEALNFYLKERDCTLCDIKQVDKLDADFYFVGFWTCRGECDSNTKRFLATLKDKDIFLFGTSGFGGNSVYYKKILRRTRKYLNASVKIVGSFMCQGKMPVQVREKYENRLHSIFYGIYAKHMIKNYDNALGHPNRQDLNQLFSEVQNILPDTNPYKQMAKSEDKI